MDTHINKFNSTRICQYYVDICIIRGQNYCSPVCQICHLLRSDKLGIAYFKIFIYYFWLHWVFIAARGLSLVALNGGYYSLWFAGFSLQQLLLLRSMGSRRVGFSSCDLQALERRLSSCATGAQFSVHVVSSRARAQTRVPCIGRQILNHCATREVPWVLL